MKFAVDLLGLLFASTFLNAASTEPGLPVWKDGEHAKLETEGWIAGALLLTDEPNADPEQDEQDEELAGVKPSAEELAQPETPSNEVPEEFWPAYFENKPGSFLIDPQGLLGDSAYRDRLNFLKYHSGDSSIDLYVYVFKGDQDIPGEVREEELIERFFSEGRPAAVVFYFMSAPQRSVLYLSPSLTDAIPISEQQRALEESTMQAFAKLDPTSQLEAFLVQVTIRLYWMERTIGGGHAMSEPFFEPFPPKPKTVPRKSRMSALFQPFVDRSKPFIKPIGAMTGTLFAGVLLLSWTRRRARYHFPEFEVEPRLEGAHAAGIGAVISFASAAIPPASQKDQVPDYLRKY